jgi:hypothetical protein
VKKVFLLAVTLIVFSCGENEKDPEWLLSESEMVELLLDFRLAEGRATNLGINEDSAVVVFKALERNVFKVHQVDSSVYKESYQYYILRPERAMVIFDAVLDSLNVIQKRALAATKKTP